MKRTMLIGLAVAVVAAVAIAQGPGAGQGPGQARGSCPLGYTGMNAQGFGGGGGWWTRVTPQTPEQEAFLERVTLLHNEIRDVRIALRLTDDPDEIAGLQARLTELRDELHTLMLGNRDLMRELMQTMKRGPGARGQRQGGFGRGGGSGRGTGVCPFGLGPGW